MNQTTLTAALNELIRVCREEVCVEIINLDGQYNTQLRLLQRELLPVEAALGTGEVKVSGLLAATKAVYAELCRLDSGENIVAQRLRKASQDVAKAMEVQL